MNFFAAGGFRRAFEILVEIDGTVGQAEENVRQVEIVLSTQPETVEVVEETTVEETKEEGN
jgi:hypothetical protein